MSHADRGSRRPHGTPETERLHVDPEVLSVLSATHDIDPLAQARSQHELAETDQTFAQAIVAEGFKRSRQLAQATAAGSVESGFVAMERQAGFIEGALFASDALRRTVAIKRLLGDSDPGFDEQLPEPPVGPEFPPEAA
jgi:hypothetical protein